MTHAHHRNLQPLPLHHWIWWPVARTGVQVYLRIYREYEARKRGTAGGARLEGCRSQVLNQHPKPDQISVNFW
ncbi:hypothetical protein V6Z11_A06G214300 [Gossypium hirsutum]